MGDGTEFGVMADIFVGVESGVVFALFIEAEQAVRATAKIIKVADRRSNGIFLILTGSSHE